MNRNPDQEAINSLVTRLKKGRTHRTEESGRPSPTPRRADAPNVEQAIRKLREDPARREIFDGGNGEYASNSEADGRMFHNLAFFCQKDLALMEEAAHRSGRVRSKWNEPRNGKTWLLWELHKAAERTQEVWEPSQRATLTAGEGSQGQPRVGDTEEDPTINAFVRADLTQALKDGVEPPETLVQDILLKGKVHSIYSAGGTGKTFKMLYLVKKVIEQGLPVLVFDMENGLRIIAERLEQLGVTPEHSVLVHYYPFPRMPIEATVIEEYEKLLDAIDPALVIFDSWLNCLAACGLDENSSVDIATWADAYSQRARYREIAVLILDHVPKEGNTARGSGRKLDYVDVQWELRNPQPFNRETVGRIDLHLRKDREGWLPSILTFAVGGGEEGFVFARSDGVILQVMEEGLLPTDRTVKDALESFGSSGAKDKDWREAAKARSIKRTTYYRCRANLLSKGVVEQVMDKYFVKDLQNDESHLVPNSPVGLWDQGQRGKSQESHTPRGGTMGPPPDTPAVDSDWMTILTEGEERQVDALVAHGMSRKAAEDEVLRKGGYE